MSRLFTSIVVACALCDMAAVPVSAQSSNLVARFEVANVVFSPDNDGTEETTNINFTLAVGAPLVSVVVFKADSVTPVDTLLSPQSRPVGRTDLFWGGLAWDGTPAPDGAYVVTLSASGAALPDTVAHRAVFIDRGAPSIVVDWVTPNPYAPGIDGENNVLSIAFTVTGTTPPLSLVPRDELQREFFQPPSGGKFTPDSLSFSPPFSGADGSYTLRWHPVSTTGIANGEHLVTLTVVDQAGHSSSSSHSFFVDSKSPDMKIKSPASGLSFRQAPAFIRGWAFDTGGVRAVDIKYSDDGPYIAVTDTSTANDTLFFDAPLADSLAGEGKYKVTVRGTDSFGRTGTAGIDVNIDLSAPQAPSLEPFTGVSHTDTYRVSGSFHRESDVVARIRINRNGVTVDSLFTLPIGEPFRFARVIGLVPGRNLITAVYVDGAGNASAPSNVVDVTFDAAVGLFIDAPFVPNDDFEVTLARPASGLALRIYDLTGDLVVVLEDSRERMSYALRWNGHNGNGDLVDRGPLVAVAEVSFEDGDRAIYRELFLFQPYPK